MVSLQPPNPKKKTFKWSKIISLLPASESSFFYGWLDYIGLPRHNLVKIGEHYSVRKKLPRRGS